MLLGRIGSSYILLNGNSGLDTLDINSNNASINLKHGIGQTAKALGKEIGIKAGIAGFAIAATLERGAFRLRHN